MRGMRGMRERRGEEGERRGGGNFLCGGGSLGWARARAAGKGGSEGNGDNVSLGTKMPLTSEGRNVQIVGRLVEDQNIGSGG